MKYTAADYRRIAAKDRTVLPCSACGAPVSFYSSEYPVFLLKGKKLCGECFERLRATETFACAGCGRVFPIRESKLNYCPECWRPRLASIRARREPYRLLLEKALAERGFAPHPAVPDVLDADGRPAFQVPQAYVGGALPLREDARGLYNGDERGVYAVRCRDALIALPDNGIGLRFMRPSADAAFMKRLGQACNQSLFVAIAGSEEDLFMLEDDGGVRALMAGTRLFSLFDREAELRRIAAGVDPKKLDAQRQAYLRAECLVASAGAEFYYDPGRRIFYKTRTYGNAHEGIYQTWEHVSRAQVVELLLARETIMHAASEAERGRFPAWMVVATLEEDPDWARASLPEDKLVY